MCASFSAVRKEPKSSQNGKKAPKNSSAQNGAKLTSAAPASKAKNSSQKETKASKNSTKVVVKFDCGFPNTLYIRGEGIKGLNWNKGQPMKNVKADRWEWECNESFNSAQIKVLINDKQYEVGPNHTINCGKEHNVTPKF